MKARICLISTQHFKFGQLDLNIIIVSEAGSIVRVSDGRLLKFVACLYIHLVADSIGSLSGSL